jgi:tRNA threonylcarbamoyladenosine biosynthesis protein TsaE
MTIEVYEIQDLQKVINAIDKNIVILSGTLSAGKTTLVKEFVKSKGISDEVTSPTFSIQNIYGDKIYHYDLYNKDINEFLSLGMLEELEKEGWHFVEWGEELEKYLKQFGFEYMIIKITLNEGKRIFECIH